MYSAVLQGCVRYGTYRGIPPVYTAGITGTGHFGSFNTTSIPVPNTSVSSAKQNPVPGTSVRSARHSTYSELQIFTFRSDEWIGLLRGRNNERVLNRIDSNILPGIFFLIDLKSIRFGGKIRLWVLSGNYLLFSNFYEIGKKQHLTQTPGRQVPRRADESDGVHRRVLAADSLFFFFAAQVRKLLLSASLEWAEAEEALERHGRDSDGDAAIEVLSFSSVFRVDRFVLVVLGRSSWWESCDCDRHDLF